MNDFFLSRPEYGVFRPLIGELGEKLSARGRMMATAESCTGGLMASLCTDMAGSSAWFAGGVVAYADMLKKNLLGVPGGILEEHGAVSGPVVRHMAAGALRACSASAAVAVSGIAGPDGGSKAKPVGTVWIAWALRDMERGGETVEAERFLFPGPRSAVRLAAAAEGFTGLLRLLP
jgi:nicotinamide-nucleotide amidase